MDVLKAGIFSPLFGKFAF